MFHILLHFIVPFAISWLFYRDRMWTVYLILIATMAVDIDHLFTDPIYDPNRCSIGFHPLHTIPAIAAYVILFLLPFLPEKFTSKMASQKTINLMHLIGLGLIIHMTLDWADCWG